MTIRTPRRCWQPWHAERSFASCEQAVATNRQARARVPDVRGVGDQRPCPQPPGGTFALRGGNNPPTGTFALHGRPIDVLPDGKTLLYVRARYYDPANGRWLQRDPAGFADGGNLYVLIGNNPARFVDVNRPGVIQP